MESTHLLAAQMMWSVVIKLFFLAIHVHSHIDFFKISHPCPRLIHTIENTIKFRVSAFVFGDLNA